MPGQPWSDEPVEHGTIVVVTANPIGRALLRMADVLGRRAVLLDHDGRSPDPADWLAHNELRPADAVVFCDHDVPDAMGLLRTVLAGPVGYVAMMGSRNRAAATIAELAADPAAPDLDRLHTPAGLNLGGRSAGEIALAVLAEVVAVGYGRSGGLMRAGAAPNVADLSAPQPGQPFA